MSMVIIRKRRRDGITQRYRVKPKKPIDVGHYKRRKPGKKNTFINVDSYKRDKRALGKHIHYTKVGVFEVAHDEKGNFRGSKVKPYKK
jgi:hypothetical protein